MSADNAIQPPPGILEFPGDVDPAAGDIAGAQDVVIQGSIMGASKVSAGSDVIVKGALEDAHVRAGRDLIVTGGIVAKDKGRCVAGRDITAKFAAHAILEAANHVTAHADVTHCRVVCGGRLIAAKSLAGGHATALGGVACAVLGSSSRTPTLVEAGIDQILRNTASDVLPGLEGDIARVRKVRGTVEPLLRNQKALTAPQKERATELLYEAGERDEQIARTLVRLQHDLDEASARAQAEVAVTDVLHAGVTIRFPGLETTIRSPLKGPLRIVPQQLGGERCIVLIEEGSEQPHSLDTLKFVDGNLDALRRTLDSHSTVKA
ncbi:MAG: polymerase [Phycisphaerales bacterium]|nr:polymerase [Phycisphaerales bacterium]